MPLTFLPRELFPSVSDFRSENAVCSLRGEIEDTLEMSQSVGVKDVNQQRFTKALAGFLKK